jgi:hypothetical protein
MQKRFYHESFNTLKIYSMIIMEKDKFVQSM